jgi:hypothetical protein
MKVQKLKKKFFLYYLNHSFDLKNLDRYSTKFEFWPFSQVFESKLYENFKLIKANICIAKV